MNKKIKLKLDELLENERDPLDSDYIVLTQVRNHLVETLTKAKLDNIENTAVTNLAVLVDKIIGVVSVRQHVEERLFNSFDDADHTEWNFCPGCGEPWEGHEHEHNHNEEPKAN